MEKLSQLWDGIKERLSSPLFFSFILSWIFLNWKVTVALLWYDSAIDKGYFGLIKYVENQINSTDSVIWPFTLAVGFTLFNPVIKNLVAAFNTWNIAWGENWNIRISKDSHVPISKYLRLRANYMKRTKTLEDIITSESQTQTLQEQTQTALLESRSQSNQLRQELSDAKAVVDGINNFSIFEGRWTKLTTNALNDEPIKESLQIQSGQVYIYDGGALKSQFRMQNFLFDRRHGKIFFNLFSTQDNFFQSTTDLNYTFDEYEGFEYRNGNTFNLKYKRHLSDIKSIDALSERSTSQ